MDPVLNELFNEVIGIINIESVGMAMNLAEYTDKELMVMVETAIKSFDYILRNTQDTEMKLFMLCIWNKSGIPALTKLAMSLLHKGNQAGGAKCNEECDTNADCDEDAQCGDCGNDNKCTSNQQMAARNQPVIFNQPQNQQLMEYPQNQGDALMQQVVTLYGQALQGFVAGDPNADNLLQLAIREGDKMIAQLGRDIENEQAKIDKVNNDLAELKKQRQDALAKNYKDRMENAKADLAFRRVWEQGTGAVSGVAAGVLVYRAVNDIIVLILGGILGTVNVTMRALTRWWIASAGRWLPHPPCDGKIGWFPSDAPPTGFIHTVPGWVSNTVTNVIACPPLSGKQTCVPNTLETQCANITTPESVSLQYLVLIIGLTAFIVAFLMYIIVRAASGQTNYSATPWGMWQWWNLLLNSDERSALESQVATGSFRIDADPKSPCLNLEGMRKLLNETFTDDPAVKNRLETLARHTAILENLRKQLEEAIKDNSATKNKMITKQQETYEKHRTQQMELAHKMLENMGGMVLQHTNQQRMLMYGTSVAAGGGAGLFNMPLLEPSKSESRNGNMRQIADSGARAPTQDELMAERMQEEEDRKAEMRQRRTRDTSNEKENRGSDDAEDDSKKKQGGNHTTHRKRKTHGGNRKTQHKRKTQNKRKVHGKRKTHGKRK
jgi:hypothetical protein